MQPPTQNPYVQAEMQASFRSALASGTDTGPSMPWHTRTNLWVHDQQTAMKRKRDDMDALESFVGSSSAAESGPSTPSQRINRRRRLQDTVNKDMERAALVDRFRELEFLGHTVPYRSMDKTLKIAEPCQTFKSFTEENPALFEDIRFEDWVFVEANSVVELNHLERFCRDYKVLEPQHHSAVAAAIEIVARKIVPDNPIPFPSRGDLRNVPFDAYKFGGIEYARRGKKTRGEAHSDALAEAEEAWDTLMEGGHVAPHMNRMGGRGKMVRREKMEEQGDKTTAGRLILMSSQRDYLLCGVTEKILTALCKAPDCPISVGKTWWQGGCGEFLERFKDGERFSCFDAAKYDSSLPPWLIKASLAILRQFFIDGDDEQYDAYWEFVAESLIYAPVFLDNGLMFKRKGGSTSGHNHNTLMQSIATLIAVYASFIWLEGEGSEDTVEEEVHAESLGDDQATAASGSCGRYTCEDIASVALQIFGIDWFGDKSFQTARLGDAEHEDFEGVQYLGKNFYWMDKEFEGVHIVGYIPYRRFPETVLKLYYPERGEQGVQAAWQRGVGHYADAAGNDRTRAMLEAYLDWLEPKVGNTQFEWSDRQRRKLGDRISDLPPPVPSRRITYYEWLQAVLTPYPVL